MRECQVRGPVLALTCKVCLNLSSNSGMGLSSFDVTQLEENRGNLALDSTVITGN